MKYHYLGILFFLSLLIPCCKEKEIILSQEEAMRQTIVRQNIEWLNKANVVDDALQAIKKDSLYFIGVYGLSLSVPGVNDINQPYEISIPIKPIYGTGDVISTSDDEQINFLAREYALQFNAIIMAHLKK